MDRSNEAINDRIKQLLIIGDEEFDAEVTRQETERKKMDENAVTDEEAKATS